MFDGKKKIFVIKKEKNKISVSFYFEFLRRVAAKCRRTKRFGSLKYLYKRLGKLEKFCKILGRFFFNIYIIGCAKRWSNCKWWEIKMKEIRKANNICRISAWEDSRSVRVRAAEVAVPNRWSSSRRKRSAVARNRRRDASIRIPHPWIPTCSRRGGTPGSTPYRLRSVHPG